MSRVGPSSQVTFMLATSHFILSVYIPSLASVAVIYNIMSNIGGNRVWTHPPDQLLDFSRNCTVWGAWLGAIMTPDTWSDDESHATLRTNLQKNVALLNSALPPNWPRATYSEAIAWWIGRQYPDFLAADCDFKHEVQYTGRSLHCQVYWNAQVNLSALVVKALSKKCQPQMCAAVARTISPDIIGVGVSTSIEP